MDANRPVYQTQPLPHADKAEAGLGLEDLWIEAHAVITDSETNSPIGERHIDPGGRRLAVFGDVREGLLDDSEQAQSQV